MNRLNFLNFGGHAIQCNATECDQTIIVEARLAAQHLNDPTWTANPRREVSAAFDPNRIDFFEGCSPAGDIIVGIRSFFNRNCSSLLCLLC